MDDTDDDLLKVSYAYLDWGGDEPRTTTTLRGINYTYVSGGLDIADLHYSYDSLGNITAERKWISNDNIPLREKYTYDNKNQLVRHDSVTQNKSWTYTYDAAGNITAKTEYAYTTGTLGTAVKTYAYGYTTSLWQDMLTRYDGKAISYDNAGNMRSYDGNTYGWTGRRMTSANIGGVACSYTYNADGIRTTKTVGGVTTEYFLNGSQIIAQKTGDDVMWFFYDANGTRIGMYYNGVTYYYLYNLQGDVVALARAYNGKIVAKYAYDAWGNCTVTNASGTTIGDINPFRYRGYYYDTESGFYYLNSRYYSPEFGRFISADAYVSTGQGIVGNNMYAYCGNNPVMYVDPTGEASAALSSAGWLAAAFASVVAYLYKIVVIDTGLGDAIADGVSKTIDNVLDFANEAIETLEPLTPEELEGIAGGYSNGECLQAAHAMQKKNGGRGNIIHLEFPRAHNGFVCSTRYPFAISSNGNHYGYLYKGIVYCNIYPEGRPMDLWINSFYDALGTAPIVKIY